MRIASLIKTAMIWAIVVCIGLSASKHIHKLLPHGGPDKIAVDEHQSRYPGLDIEEVCKQAKNPKCEAIIDGFCAKSCSGKLCAKHGSVRAMCRLMCAGEDLLPECSKMSSSTGGEKKHPKKAPPPDRQIYQEETGS